MAHCSLFFLLYKCSILLRLWVSTYQVAVMYSRKVHSGTASPSGKGTGIGVGRNDELLEKLEAQPRQPACLVSLSLFSFLLSRKGGREGGREGRKEGGCGGGM